MWSFLWNEFFLLMYSCVDAHMLHINSYCDAEDRVHLSPWLSYVRGAAAGCAATVGSYPLIL